MRTATIATTLAALALVGCGDKDGGDDVEINSQPVANAGSDVEQDADSAVSLDGSGSYDPDGDSLVYH